MFLRRMNSMDRNKTHFGILICILLLLMIGLSGCRKKEFSYRELDLTKASSRKLQNRINELFSENGVYILQDSKHDNVIYLIFNSFQTDLEGNVGQYSNIEIKSEDDTIRIDFDYSVTEYASKTEIGDQVFYKVSEGDLYTGQLVYKIMKEKEYEYLSLYKNGEEAYFDGIGG
jgi:hypothetical protein